MDTGHESTRAGSVESKHQPMRDFAAYLLTAREEERKRLANDIHDKLAQNLLALRIDVSRLHARTMDAHPRINSQVVNVLADVDVAIRNVRDIINHLRPAVVELGLLASVEWKVREFEKHARLPCSLVITGSDDDYLEFDGHAAPVSRILDEALTNVVRHAQASAAEVALSNAERMLSIKVYDDGIGIQPDDLKKPNVYGLLAIQEYARLLKGEFAVGKSGREKGTLLRVALPAAGGES